MSPKSRGRPAGRGKPKARRPHGPARELRLSDRVLQGAEELVTEPDVLEVERRASGWLGAAWSAASMDEGQAKHQLLMEVVGLACAKPSPKGLAVLWALRRVAPVSEFGLLDEAIALLQQTQPDPSWSATPPFEAVRAWRAVDIWDGERVLFVEYTSSDPAATGHTLVAQVVEAGTTMVSKLAILNAGAAGHWETMHDADAPPMPLVELPVAEVLADLAGCLRTSDMLWPRPDDQDFVDHRALAWTRSRAFLPGWPDVMPLTDAERDELAGAFTAFTADGSSPAGVNDEVVRSLVTVFLDFGDGYLHDRPLGWSPRTVAMFLADWLPRKVVLDAEQQAALPVLLPSWIRFALGRRGVPARWIEPVLEAVDDWLPDYQEALGTASGPAQEIAAALLARGTDLDDKDAVDQVVRELNAARLARGLLG